MLCLKRFLAASIIAATTVFTQAANAQVELSAPPVEPAKIAILGVYHFSNPGLDQFNPSADDVMIDKRQQEIQDLVDALARFRPTKIALEASPTITRLHDQYAAYLRGEHQLNSNERQQIGFRLAKMLGHDQIYLVDERSIEMTYGIAPERLAAMETEFPELSQQLNQYGQAAVATINHAIETMTIPEVLRFMNQPEMHAANHLAYAQFFMAMGDETHTPGPEMLANWYRRNIMVSHNLLRIREGGDDRILLIFGQGHVRILNHLIEDSPYFELEDVLDYLPE